MLAGVWRRSRQDWRHGRPQRREQMANIKRRQREGLLETLQAMVWEAKQEAARRQRVGSEGGGR